MRKVAVILLALAFISFVSFAQAASEGKQSLPEKAQIVVGKVLSVVLMDPAKGITQGAITIADDMGKTTTYVVKSTAKILSDTLSTITLNKINVGNKVEIQKSGANEAKSIKVVK